MCILGLSTKHSVTFWAVSDSQIIQRLRLVGLSGSNAFRPIGQSKGKTQFYLWLSVNNRYSISIDSYLVKINIQHNTHATFWL